MSDYSLSLSTSFLSFSSFAGIKGNTVKSINNEDAMKMIGVGIKPASPPIVVGIPNSDANQPPINGPGTIVKRTVKSIAYPLN